MQTKQRKRKRNAAIPGLIRFKGERLMVANVAAPRLFTMDDTIRFSVLNKGVKAEIMKILATQSFRNCNSEQAAKLLSERYAITLSSHSIKMIRAHNPQLHKNRLDNGAKVEPAFDINATRLDTFPSYRRIRKPTL